jgi:nitroimidazol reductase NimA-like FMN-containing flavoprotein (pyridoxamine 5'-phosphate oxidase superfamily)
MIAELSRTEIDALLREERVARIGCHADGVTYVVPVIYVYDGESVYVQTVEGQKTRMMRASPEVCVEVDRYERESGSWRSVIAYGRYDELAGAEAERALALLVDRFARDGGSRRRPEPTGRRPVAFRIRIERATGRAVDRDPPQ